MNFDFKVTAWERVTVPEEQEQEILEAIKSKKIQSAEGIFTYLCSVHGDSEAFCEIVDESAEQMSLEENKGFATIEVVDDKGVTLYNNEQG